LVLVKILTGEPFNPDFKGLAHAGPVSLISPKGSVKELSAIRIFSKYLKAPWQSR